MYRCAEGDVARARCAGCPEKVPDAADASRKNNADQVLIVDQVLAGAAREGLSFVVPYGMAQEENFVVPYDGVCLVDFADVDSLNLSGVRACGKWF